MFATLPPLRMQSQKQHLRVVLFASGTGGNTSSYKPNCASQWWNRRDALVRCVAALLFGPRETNDDVTATSHAHNTVELIILFDQDWSRLCMTVGSFPPSSIIPTERALIGLWKKCSKSPNTRITVQGLTCELIPGCMANTNSSTQPTSPIDSKSSKRDILAHLQSTCDVDFLRLHRLNSSSDAILRKANKDNLISLLSTWRTQQPSFMSSWTIKKRHHQSNDVENDKLLSIVLKQLLHPVDGQGEVLAATLHESSDHEFPLIRPSRVFTSSPTTICLFLGVVRDMSSSENRCLGSVCSTHHLHLIRIRLGHVAEFTSKILTIIAFHFAARRLLQGLQVQLSVNASPQRKRPRQLNVTESINKRTNLKDHKLIDSLSLTYVVFVPFESCDISFDLNQRYKFWSLIRTAVAALWRSRVASIAVTDKSSCSITYPNQLVLVFSDQLIVELNENAVVDMADRHQAAPCERQVLELIHKKIEAVRRKNNPESTELREKNMVENTINRMLQISSPRINGQNGREVNAPVVALDFVPDGKRKLVDDFYCAEHRCLDDSSSKSMSLNLFALIALENNSGECLLRQEFRRVLMKDLRGSLNTVTLGLSCDCADRCAATVTLLQHIGYIFPRLLHHFSSRR